MTASHRGLVDTNVLILIDRLNPEELPDDIAVSTVTMAELAAGPHFTDNPVERAERIERLQNAEAQFDPLPFDTTAARRYGHLIAAVMGSGRNPKPRRIDLMIAAIASAHRIPLYTVNPKDFRALDGLLTVVPVAHPDGR
ncbi:type II toxin-antitoxin system VapC family toxin [Nocardia rhamnosiphila]|uniref:type II toxin-antitoxin system VapC family toxin n=1 Tax=Nocardia rhamnosiphila TaxID=426716 RepID=UPI0004C2B42C|nr:type II toxin-antitoxin system VapC family toxin [Nocardia rhamnosiphila]